MLRCNYLKLVCRYPSICGLVDSRLKDGNVQCLFFDVPTPGVINLSWSTYYYVLCFLILSVDLTIFNIVKILSYGGASITR